MFTPQPSYQASVVPTSMSYTGDGKMRTVPDVAMDAGTGVAVADSFDNGASTPWFDGGVGGTSLSAPMWAGVMALVNQGRVINHLSSLDGLNQALPALYKLPASDFHDITVGSNGYDCQPGYDLVTGRGTPIVNLLAPAMAKVSVPAIQRPTIGLFTATTMPFTSTTPITLIASNVAPHGGVNVVNESVSFYLETNGLPGYQVTDALLGTVTAPGFYAYSFALGTEVPGNYTFYAVATNSAGVDSVASALKVMVTVPRGAPPAGGSGTVTPGTGTGTGAFGTYWWNSPDSGLFRSNHF
jgi:subtilase family serine protease